MYQVVKRDGTTVEFEISKISAAMVKAFDALQKNYHTSVINLLALQVCADFEPRIQNDKISVEDIQDSVERVLSASGYADVAKAYILYRKQREKVRNVNSALLNYKDLVDNYLQINDWRVKENSTVTYSVGGLILSNSGAITANYWLSEIYDEEIAEAHRSAAVHIHDLSMLTGYCAGWSLKQLIQEGLGGVPGKITSSPASHLSTLCNQMVNFLGIMQNEWAGAQAFSSFDTYLAPFVKVDNLSQKEVKQCIQSFIYGVNTPSRWGTQAPFSNITLDWTVPNDLKDLPAIVGGKEMDFTYGDCKKEMDMVNKAFTEASQYELGTVMPKLYGGFGTTLHAYGLDLSAQFSFQLGGKYYDGTYQALMHTSSGTGMAWHRDALNSWSESNTDTNIPRLDGDTSVGQTAVDNYLISSNYLSVNNVTLGYTFPAKWTTKINVAGFRVYVAADNLAVFSARKGVDPRYSMGLGSFTSGSGLNSGSYSSMRTITGGVTLTF